MDTDPSKQVDPGEGWRLLVEKEWRELGDEQGGFFPDFWRPIHPHFVGRRWLSTQDPVRRRIQPPTSVVAHQTPISDPQTDLRSTSEPQDMAERAAREMNCIGLLRPYEGETEADAVRQAAHIIRAEQVTTEARIKTLETALIRLRDCDWVITPHDRMDAVREVARKALEGKS